MRRTLLIAGLLLVTGCSSLKEGTGTYVTEAVVDHIADQIDRRLERRGLSIEQIRSVTDLNDDGTVDMAEVRETAKAAVSDLVVSYTTKLETDQRTQWEQATKNLVTRDEQAGIKGDLQDFWAWIKATLGLLITTIMGYLTKQVFSAKSDGKRDASIAKGHARMDMLEKLLHRDLNNDGSIGGDPSEDESDTTTA